MSRRKILAVAVSVILAAAVLYGLVLVGSPERARRLAADRQRIDDLRYISQLVSWHHQETGGMPEVLSELAVNGKLGYRPFPADPETGAAYEYLPDGEGDGLGYRLCAEFAAGVSEQPDYAYRRYASPTYPGDESLRDPFLDEYRAGRHCFSLKVKPAESEMKPQEL